MSRDLYEPFPDSREETDSHQQTFDFGDGGVPWYLLLFYLSFLVFFTWYTVEFQLPDFVESPPIELNGSEAAADDGALPNED